VVVLAAGADRRRPMTSESRDHFIDPPQRRIGALGVLRNEDGAVLFAEKAQPEPQHPRALYLPGGCVEGDEDITAGLVRAAHHKLGIDVTPGRLLAVHHMHEKDWESHVSLEGVNLVFDCGVWDGESAFAYGPGFIGHRWVHPGDLESEVMWYTAKRVRSALRALQGEHVEVLADT
jgi:ADP-ribose pyrophosphatase YjhB (NUDIX family)